MSVKISQLSASSEITSDDFFPVVDSGSMTTKRASAEQVLDYVTGSTFNSLTVVNLTGSNVTGSTAQFTTVSASNLFVSGGNAVFYQSVIIDDYAYILYNSSIDKLAVFPGLYVTGAITASTVVDAPTGRFTILSGSTITGSTALFTTITGSNVTGSTARFTTITGSTITGSTAQFTTITGSTITGSTARFTTITGSTITGSTALFTTITGSNVTGSTALFTTITGSNVTGSTARFTTITGSNVTGSTAQFTTITGSNIFEIVSGSAYNVATQYDIGTEPNKIPLNQYLGSMAYQNVESVVVDLLSGTTAQFTTITGSTGIFTNLTASSFSASQPSVVDVNSTSVALRVTQRGTGEAIRVEDSANPDASPFVIDADGFVGIGTSSPSSKLHVSGGSGLRISTVGAQWAELGADVAGANYMKLNRPGTTVALGYIGGGAGGAISDGTVNDLAIRSEASLYLATNGNVQRVIVNAAGNVGIGTSSPTNTLQVVGAVAIRGDETANNNKIHFQASDNSNRFTIETDLDSFPTNDLLTFRSGNSSNTLVLTGDGNVGIRTSRPQYELTVGDPTVGLSTDVISSSPNAVALRFGDASGWKFHIARARETGGGAYNTGVTGSLVTFQDNGNVGIGTTNPSARLDVNGNTVISGNLNVTGPIVVTGSISAPTGTFTMLSGSSGNITISGSLSGMIAALTSSASNYTFVAADSGKVVVLSSSSGITASIPTGLPVGFTTTIVQNGIGSIFVSASSGVVIRNRQNHTTTAGLYATVTIIGTGSNSYIFAGDTAV